MPASFHVPDDPVALRMENDLLMLEVEHLRGHVRDMPKEADSLRRHLARAEQLRAQAESQHVRAESQLARAESQLAAERERVEQLTRARSDLRWLLRRLDGSPAGFMLRRFEGFRTLMDRWLDQ